MSVGAERVREEQYKVRPKDWQDQITLVPCRLWKGAGVYFQFILKSSDGFQ